VTTESRTGPSPADEPTRAEACYLYAVVPAGTDLPEGLTGTDGGEVSLVRHRDLAGVISRIHPDRMLGTREDLLAHRCVMEALAAETTTLPLRFGAVVSTPEAVVDEMLAPHHDWFVDVLGDLAGRREFAVVGTYVEDTVLREVLEEEPEARRLRESIAELPEDASYYDRVRLGEIIVQALDRKREVDTDTAIDRLAPFAVDAVARRPAGEDAAVDVVLLVKDDDRSRFEQAVDELGEQWSGRVRLRVLGPLPAYDFVPSRREDE
jgi:Gas vesicle synthesis protein GvpL/GvpF